MKKEFRILLVLCLIAALVLSLAGCVYFSPGTRTITGSGKNTTKETDLKQELKGVSTSSVINVILDPELEGKFRLEGDSNILDYIVAEQGSDGILRLGFQPGISILSAAYINAYVPRINGGLFETSSVGSITMKGSEALSGDRFDIVISSTGSITLAINTKELRVNDSSTGTVTLTGSAQKADITLSSTGSFEGYGLAAGDTTVVISSTGSAYVNVSGQLDATVSSVGSVIYEGSPKKVNTHGGGMGSVMAK